MKIAGFDGWIIRDDFFAVTSKYPYITSGQRTSGKK